MPRISGWGNYPSIDTNLELFDTIEQAKSIVLEAPEIVYQGNLRSYGDSALNERALNTRNFSYVFDFDKKSGILHATSGLLIGDILSFVVEYGWFLAVVPGTKLVSIGGAIAADVHGKNHHIDGGFSNFVVSFNLMLPNGEIINCSKHDNEDLFYATCGGMGLTGLILDVVIQLVPIDSAYLQRKTIVTKGLEETFQVMEDLRGTRFLVSWIDTSAEPKKIGRAKITSAEFINDSNYNVPRNRAFSIPSYLPGFCMASQTIRAMNACYFALPIAREKVIDFDRFFFPLDAIGNWNKVYGRKGFIQYQFVVPKKHSEIAIKRILEKLRELKLYSFLSVLKNTGKCNKGWLSFPMEGMSLALDFQYSDDLLPKLELLDEIVIGYGGRLYLAKDCRMSQSTFKAGYRHYEKFKNFRIDRGMKARIESKQSIRLGL